MNEELRQILLDMILVMRMTITDISINSTHVEDYPRLINDLDALRERIHVSVMNKFMVAAQRDGILIMNPPRHLMSYQEALELAAYLVSMSEPWSDKKFEDVLKEVQSS